MLSCHKRFYDAKGCLQFSKCFDLHTGYCIIAWKTICCVWKSHCLICTMLLYSIVYGFFC